jgi:hypothetical protein
MKFAHWRSWLPVCRRSQSTSKSSSSTRVPWATSLRTGFRLWRPTTTSYLVTSRNSKSSYYFRLRIRELHLTKGWLRYQGALKAMRLGLERLKNASKLSRGLLLHLLRWSLRGVPPMRGYLLLGLSTTTTTIITWPPRGLLRLSLQIRVSAEFCNRTLITRDSIISWKTCLMLYLRLTTTVVV